MERQSLYFSGPRHPQFLTNHSLPENGHSFEDVGEIFGKFSGHSSVIQVVDNGRTKGPFLAACIRNIWLLAAT